MLDLNLEPANAQRSFRVLIADDTQANRALLRAYLVRLGFETLMAEDGEQALELFERERPDIVLMDLMMPKMDGFESIERIRMLRSDRWVPIVIVSAMDAEYDITRGLEAGADDFMTKPLSYQMFAAKMRNLSRALEFQVSREESQRREAAIADAVIDGIITFDAGFCVVDANRAAATIFGRSEGELPGSDLRNHLREPSGEGSWERHFRACVEGRDPDFIGSLQELMGRRADGRMFPCEICVTELPLAEERLFIAVVRDISERKRVGRQLTENAARLQQYHDEAEAEAELAKDIMERHIRRDALEQSGVQQAVIPTQRFSGDIVLAARSRSGKLYAMLADATGHGLAAAMSGLAIVNDFYRAVEDDVPLRRMILMLNNTLAELLPRGRFVSAAVLVLDQKHRRGEMWQGGVPDVLQVAPDGQLLARYRADQLPLGIEVWQAEEVSITPLEWNTASQLLLCSDGLIEACSGKGEEFGYEGVLAALASSRVEGRLDALQVELRRHLDVLAGHDDISMLLLDLPV
ncbi:MULTISPECIES: SpoIIE family protein phosphatase [unclassified Uliginosibacterium]|uniref:SpoIIE family protein phosphatase n=1 Tax=unclassified Uliginosibacterium TaxID=2621521 RepID=UPI000C7C6925|nr:MULTISPECIES: SpoIIE family protein phosphatase [unclassified Uliginosibacterium]MDO6387594.1 response regulator [Uliginosibacterium sp. 31-12]PLK47916.1 PAS domain S-box protein [Uliginosibacterium sp. TH139]